MKFIKPKFEHKKSYLIPSVDKENWEDASWAYYSRNPLIREIYFSRLRKVLEMADEKRGQKILDLGTGSGVLIPSLGKYNKVYAIDREKMFIKKAKKIAKMSNVKAICIRQDISSKLPFKNSFFDAVFCVSVLEHIEDLDKVMKEVKRIIKPGGLFIVGLPIERFLVKSAFNIFGIKQHEDRGHISDFADINKKLKKYFDIERTEKIPFNLFPDALSLYIVFKCRKK